MPDNNPKPRKRFEKKKELTDEELEAEKAGQLPDREALSVLDANIPIPADPSIAADVLSGEDPPLPDDPGS